MRLLAKGKLLEIGQTNTELKKTNKKNHMKKNINNKNFMSNLVNLAAILFVFLFGACTEEHFIPEDNGENPPVVIPGDTIIRMDEFNLNHADWSSSNGLAKADHYFDGYIEFLVDEEVVKTTLIDHENAPMSISWEPINETISASAEKMYIGQTSGEAKFIESHKNQEVTFAKYERESKLSFVGLDVTLKASWYQAALNSAEKYCRYDSTTVATQVQDTAMINGVKEEVEVDGKKYYRVNVIAKAENHFTDMPAKTAHVEPMDINYSVLVPVIFVPGNKIYEGSIAGNGSYVKASEESYRSELELTHIFTQDGAQIKEQETVSGIATVKTWVEEAGAKMIVPTIEIGNPTVSVSESTSDLYQKEGYIYAKKYTTTWTYTWANGFTKKVYSEVERLYYMREEGKAVAMPFGETSTSFSNFNAGNSVEKSENGKKYEAYPNGMVYFSGAHKSTTGNVNDQIAGLAVGQEFWVEKEEAKDEFLGFDKEVIAGNNNKDAQIIITEHWSISGDKDVVFSQSANYTFSVSEQQRVLGENLTFVSGLSKSTDNPKFNEVKEGQFARTITSTYVAKFNLCEVKAIAKATEAYVEYRNEKINFEFAETSVEYKGINNPTATEVTVDGILYSRKAYEVSFAHSVLGTKSASVLVDQEIDMDPTTPDEWGKLDIEKTKNFGGLSWSWKNVGGKLVPFVSGTIVTEYGIVSFWEGGNNFTKMDTNTINGRLSNSIKSEGPEYLIPAYIRILTDPNKHWGYQDINGQYRDEINGVDIEMLKDVSLDKPFIAEGGEANVYEISNGRVIVTYQGKVLFNEVFAK